MTYFERPCFFLTWMVLLGAKHPSSLIFQVSGTIIKPYHLEMPYFFPQYYHHHWQQKYPQCGLHSGLCVLVWVEKVQNSLNPVQIHCFAFNFWNSFLTTESKLYVSRCACLCNRNVAVREKSRINYSAKILGH